MRAFEILTETYRYAGSCVGAHAPDLEAMMDAAKQISYRTFVAAVGLDAMRTLFANFAWGHQRGNIRMKNDANVTYFKSVYKGKPCYYVRESGVEYIFVDDDGEPAEVKTRPVQFSILPDGDLLKSPSRASVFWGSKSSRKLVVVQSHRANEKSVATLINLIRAAGLETVEYEDEEWPVDDLIRDLKRQIA